MFDTPPRAVLLDAGETLLYAPHADATIRRDGRWRNRHGIHGNGVAGSLE